MSYILDALKKSEQEREEKNQQSINVGSDGIIAPTILSAESSKGMNKKEMSKSTADSSWLIRLIYVGLIILAVLVLVKIFDANKPLPIEAIEPELVSMPEPIPISKSAPITKLEPVSKPAPVKTQPAIVESVLVNPVSTKPKIDIHVPEKKVVSLPVLETAEENFEEASEVVFDNINQNREPAIDIEQASVDLVKDIPSLNISSHIFSTQASRRSIVVNNNRLIEGSYITSDVRIYTITNNGMVIDVQGQLLTVNRSRGWTAK